MNFDFEDLVSCPFCGGVWTKDEITDHLANCDIAKADQMLRKESENADRQLGGI